MMRADIEHLPYAVQEELDHVANILFEEFAEAMRGKQALHRKAGRIVKLILFGAFADPGWGERDVGDGLTAFDILVIVNHNELADAGNWLFANDRLHRAWQAGILLRPVRLTTCGLARINRALIAGIPFFTAIAEQGTIIYQFCDRPLATARSLPDAERHARATRAFDKWHPRARDFLDGARFFRDAGRVAMAALTPETMAERIGKAAEVARKADDAAFRQWDKLLDAKVRQVETIIGTADTKDRQKTMLLAVGLVTGFIAFLSGIFLPVMVLRALPASWHEPEAMAAWVMDEPGFIDAGAHLLRTGDPAGWQEISAAAEMRRANRDAIAACERAAAKAKEPVRCTIRIGAQSGAGGSRRR